mmetsp:Transcript_97282/g.253688  ORF Transcript_97282/g.253688 Transcript_97282/m.253688 type:complete len:209 (+) Transcript_97282:571-1197(+)
MNRDQGVADLVPIDAARDHHEERQHRCVEAAEIFHQVLRDRIGGIGAGIAEVRGRDVEEHDREDVEYDADHYEAPEEGDHGVQDHEQHEPQLREEPDHARYPRELQEADEAQQAACGEVRAHALLIGAHDEVGNRQEYEHGVEPRLAPPFSASTKGRLAQIPLPFLPDPEQTRFPKQPCEQLGREEQDESSLESLQPHRRLSTCDFGL